MKTGPILAPLLAHYAADLHMLLRSVAMVSVLNAINFCLWMFQNLEMLQILFTLSLQTRNEELTKTIEDLKEEVQCLHFFILYCS